jgi:hypothetical protein
MSTSACEIIRGDDVQDAVGGDMCKTLEDDADIIKDGAAQTHFRGLQRI